MADTHGLPGPHDIILDTLPTAPVGSGLSYYGRPDAGTRPPRGLLLTGTPQDGPAPELLDRLGRLESELDRLAPLLVAFSGGVDSTFLLAAAVRRLGAHKVRAVTVISPSLARREQDETRLLAAEIGVELILVEGEEMFDPHYLRNAPDRCYFCKADLVERMVEVSVNTGFSGLCYGAITDDLGDDRPGMKAAREGGLRAPLVEAGFSKKDVRELSRHWGLRTWDKPAMACLSSRIPSGTPITPALLDRVDRAEQVLLNHGFRQVRVRSIGDGARLELDREGLARLSGDPRLMAEIVAGIRAAGFREVALDPNGYRQGSLNLAFRSR